jgi:hypothetical protein
MAKLREWHQISSNYNDTLIVGNGGSVAVNSCFLYKSLYAHGCEKGEIRAAAQKVFEQFAKENRDFERILHLLWQADFINNKFELAESEQKKVRKAYTDVRRALINTVKTLHPDKDLCGDFKLKNIGRFMSRFSTVFSLNYDLIVYWALLDAKTENLRQFKDGFRVMPTRQSSKIMPKLMFDFGFTSETEQGLTKVFYPHGNLALYQTLGGEESKLVASGSTDLLSSITKRWADNDGQPLFVCEGSAEAKLASISQSKYLSSVFNHALPASRKSLTIYGWSIGKQDTHILKQLALSNCQSAAVSVYAEDKTDEEVAKEKDGMRDMLRTYAGINQVEFFDAKSAGCWANEERN